MPFGLKNAPSEFQKMMNDIFHTYHEYILVYIDDVLIFSKSLDQHWKHLNTFQYLITKNGLVLSERKIKLFQTSVNFLGFKIQNQTLTPVNRVIDFANKFPDQLTDKKQLQRFLGCLNYLSDFYKKSAFDRKPLQQLLKNDAKFIWTPAHTQAIQKIKINVKSLPCLHIAHSTYPKIVQTDASDLGYGGILLQKPPEGSEQLICYTSKLWNETQQNYSTVKKEILAIVLCVQKFQSDILNQKFLIRVDCKAAKEILLKDIKNLVSKQIFARWQAILSIFDFEIEYIKGEHNSLPDFLSREFLAPRSSNDHLQR